MKRFCTNIFLLGSVFTILFSFDAFNALVRFLIIGELPGGSINISAGGMLLFILTVTAMICIAFVFACIDHVHTSHTVSFKDSLPKKRYSN